MDNRNIEYSLIPNKLILTVGQRLTGKTIETTKAIDKFINPINSENIIRPRKVLIFDTNHEYKEFETIRVQEIKNFIGDNSNGVKRILSFVENNKTLAREESFSLIEQTLSELKNQETRLKDCIIIIEDPFCFLTPKNKRYKIYDIRPFGVGMVLNFESHKQITPRLWLNVNILKRHFDLQHFNSTEKEIMPYFDFTNIGHLIVRNKYIEENKKTYCLIDYDNMKLIGDYDKADFDIACREHLREHPEKVNETKEKLNISDYEEALKMVKSDLYNQYYNGI